MFVIVSKRGFLAWGSYWTEATGDVARFETRDQARSWWASAARNLRGVSARIIAQEAS